MTCVYNIQYNFWRHSYEWIPKRVKKVAKEDVADVKLLRMLREDLAVLAGLDIDENPASYSKKELIDLIVAKEKADKAE